MIYFDNSATSLPKPPQVALAVADAINSFGNQGRSFHEASIRALRSVHKTREALGKLVSLENPLGIAFTSGATESLNLVIQSMITKNDAVITTLWEHNSVLRPLYLRGCSLSFTPCDSDGNLMLDSLEGLLKENTRYLIASHASNVTGQAADVERLKSFCSEHNLFFILDVSQTLGSIEVSADMADVLCFTGHKALLGPQGTGGIITKKRSGFQLVKTGGSGTESFAPHQSLEMPDVFEAGTMNAHGLAGLKEGVEFINKTGVDTIQKHCNSLRESFLRGISQLKNIKIYGNGQSVVHHLSVLSLTVENRPSEEVALRLWDGWGIATRAGFHCAPLIHKHFGTERQGMVRFSFGYFNTISEVETAISALKAITRRE